ncbi:MAG: hypothetical protein OEY38_09725 [Gammaproteobacteria bacterium]|nr:hypothetical protein [Gammaproteobacteria bacterium]
MKLKFTLLLCSFLLILSACGIDKGREAEANKLALNYITTVHEKGLDQAMPLLSDDFFQQRSRSGWKEYFTYVRKQLGATQKIKLKNRISDNRYSGTFYMFQFSNKFEHGFTKEMVTIVDKVDNKGPLKVFAHKVESSKLSEN